MGKLMMDVIDCIRKHSSKLIIQPAARYLERLKRGFSTARPWPIIKSIIIILIAMSLIEVVSLDFAYVMAADILFYMECVFSVFLAGTLLRRYPIQGARFLSLWSRLMLGEVAKKTEIPHNSIDDNSQK
jgi:hypothetical protein